MELVVHQATSASAHGQSNNHPYSSSISSSASSSSSSVFSIDGASSQGSICSISSASSVSSSLHVVWESEDSASNDNPASQQNHSANDGVKFCSRPKAALKITERAVAPEERVHPRRTNRYCQDSKSGCPAAGAPRPPSLVRQSDRKNLFVEGLVDCSAQIVEVIWPLSVSPMRTDSHGKGVLPLRTFIQETLRRSRTSYSTLQVALYYLILIRSHVPAFDFTMEQPDDSQRTRALQCGRRMFLSALILASKYLQDRNYSSRAWSKISGLNTAEINANEMTFLFAINWRLHLSETIYQRWADLVLMLTSSPTSPTSSHSSQIKTWAFIVPHLTPELDVTELGLQHHSQSITKSESPYAIPSPPSSFSGSPRLGLNSNLSNESIPSSSNYLPRVLEPAPNMTVLPPIIRMGPLPTPQLTPQNAGFNTPSGSVSSACSRRSSIGAAFDLSCSRPTSPPVQPLHLSNFRRCSPSRLSKSTHESRPMFSISHLPSLSPDRSETSSPMQMAREDVTPTAEAGACFLTSRKPQRIAKMATPSAVAATTNIPLGRGVVFDDKHLVASPITLADICSSSQNTPTRDCFANRKRRFCGEEVGKTMRVRRPGPGMWDGIL